MRRERSALLIGYIDIQLKDIEELIIKIKKVEPTSEEKTVFIGYILHNIYSALEDLFKEVAKTFENTIEDTRIYHKELLIRMIIDVPGIRPPLLTKESYKILNELRGFRHVFRYSYSFELDPIKVGNLKEKFSSYWPGIKADMEKFVEFLRGLTKIEN